MSNTPRRPAAPRPLWPRLTLVALATLVVLLLLGVALVRLLPARQDLATRPPGGKRAAPPTESGLVWEKLPIRSAVDPNPPVVGPARGPEAVAPPEAKEPPKKKPIEEPPVKPTPVPVPVPAPEKAPTPVKPPVPPPPPRPAVGPRELQAGDSFYQEVHVTRTSATQSLAGLIRQDTRYALLSRFEVEKRQVDGGLVVRQKVEGVRLTRADAAMQAQFNALLQKARGSNFTIETDARGQVVRFLGGKDDPRVLANPLAGGQAFLLWSFLDADGWKELAQLSLFRPERPVARGKGWSRPVVHNWGPLGSWVGRADYTFADRRGDLEQFGYTLRLAHRPPAGGGLGSLALGKMEFRLVAAGGSIAFDPAKGRVSAFEEQFRVQGQVEVGALGVVTTIGLDEAQSFQVRLHDANPWKE